MQGGSAQGGSAEGHPAQGGSPGVDDTVVRGRPVRPEQGEEGRGRAEPRVVSLPAEAPARGEPGAPVATTGASRGRPRGVGGSGPTGDDVPRQGDVGRDRLPAPAAQRRAWTEPRPAATGRGRAVTTHRGRLRGPVLGALALALAVVAGLALVRPGQERPSAAPEASTPEASTARSLDDGSAAAGAPAAGSSAGSSEGDAATGGGDATARRDDPAAAARELTTRRVALFAGDVDADAVTVPGSAARAADDATAARVHDRGTFSSRPSVSVQKTRVVGPDQGEEPASTARSVEVAVTYRVGAYTLTTAAGGEVAVPATATRTDRLLLAWTDDGWRVRSVAAPGR